MKKVLITGGTGTVGEAFIKEYYDEYEFITLSRNEAKIAEVSKSFPKVKTFVADVTDYEQLSVIISKELPDIIIHSAALKHIDIAEKNPTSAILSNIIGSYNIVKAAVNNNISLTVGISTDKACDPKSVYGYTKKLMEEMFLDNHTEKTRFVCTRFANVAGSNGSVIPFWKSLVDKGLPIKLTDKNMNRLMFGKKDAANLIHEAILISDSDKSKSFILSKKMKSVNLYELAKVMSNDWNIEITGLRPGEKLNESLISSAELKFTDCNDEYIKIYKHPTNVDSNLTKEYSSITAESATIEEMLELINQN
jgi:UDP-N-acetylglucosamine 4,6-dehydratase